MGAQCSSGSGNREPIYNLQFLGTDKDGQLLMFRLFRFTIGRIAKVLPRLAFIIEEISTELRDEEAYYIGGRSPVMPFSYFKGLDLPSDGLVYLIDSVDTDELNAALDTLDQCILKDDLTKNQLMMILANRQDVEGALPLEKIEIKVKEKLSAHDPNLGGRILFLRGCNSQTRMGLKEAILRFVQLIHQHREGQLAPGYHSVLEDDIPEKKEEYNLFHSLKKVFDASYIKSALLR